MDRRDRKVFDALPSQDLPPDELARARGLIHIFIGGPATVGKHAAGRVLVRLTLDGRPLLGASGQNASNLIAGTCFCAYRLEVELR